MATRRRRGSSWRKVQCGRGIRVGGSGGDAKRREWRRFRDRLDPDPSHTDQVARIALSLFDDLRSLHRLGETSRDLLEGAALLHDVGWSVAGEDHHKHSRDLVSRAPFRHTPGRERARIAALCRYHRGKAPGARHREFEPLPEGEREEIRRLAAILRIADGLDRGHRGAARRVRARIGEGAVTFRVDWAGPHAEEEYGFARKKELFEATFGCAALLAAWGSEAVTGGEEPPPAGRRTPPGGGSGP